MCAHSAAILKFASHPTDGAVFSTASEDGTVALWDVRCLKQRSCIKRLHAYGSLHSKLQSHNAERQERRCESVASAGSGADFSDKPFPLSKSAPMVQPTCCCFDASGQWLAVGYTGGTLRYWSLQVDKVACSLELDSTPLVRISYSTNLHRIRGT